MIPSGLAFLFTFQALVAWGAPGPDNMVGHWAGALVRQGAVQPVELNFSTSEGRLHGKYSIPELGLYNEVLSDVAVRGNDIEFRLLYGAFGVKVHHDIQEMVGGNEKWGPPIRLHAKRVVAPAVCRYEEIRFRNGAVHLTGTLVLPVGTGPFPAAVVICGSSPEGRYDGPDAWGYRGWGESLARLGVAAVVYDKRGVGQSSGVKDKWTLSELADDALAAVESIRKRADIDATRIGLVGMSQGGWVAPIAAVKDQRIAFLILQVPPAVSVREQELDAVAAQLTSENAREKGITLAHSAEAQAFQREMFEVAYGRKPWTGFKTLCDHARKRPWAEFIEIPDSERDLEWWRRNEFDPEETLRRVRCPVLAIFGELDPLVPPTRNVPLFKKYFGESDNRDIEIHVLPGVGHGCELPRRLIGTDWKWPESFWVWPRKAPGFYSVIDDWVRRRVDRR